MNYLPATNPILSVIVTCYNDGLFIEEAINSVLRSDFRDIEIIVVDDCSTDDYTKRKLEELERSGIKIIRLPENKLVGNSRNKGIAESKGKYILTLDADDRILPDYIGKSVTALEKGFDVVYCNVKRFGNDDSVRVAPEYSLPRLLAGNFISSCSAFTRNMWESVGGYDTSLKNYEDWEFWVHIAVKGGKFFHINEVLFEYRARENSKISRTVDPAKRASVVEYVCTKHAGAYREQVTQIVPYLHGIIASAENNLAEQAQLLGGPESASLLSKLRFAEDELKRKTEYYENSFFWKLKKFTDKLRGK
jgi:glycosyltransferase involved in cell wall biosynthesis